MTKENYYRDIEDIAEAIKNSRELGYKINLLIGAGCSISAGIPSANEFVKIISKLYSREYSKCETKTYAECMKKLTPIERRNLISTYIKNSKINWAHLCIAQLIKNEYIDRVLTTNFDNLIVKACSIVQEYPAIYDLTSCTQFRTDLMLDKSILYLHGQYNGFILCNTEDEVNAQKENIESIFHELNSNSVWIIVGYSGENDAIRDLLACNDLNENRLFWVGYDDNIPSEYVKDKILSQEKYSFFINGYDADRFFVKLTKILKCFPPEIIGKPFSYLKHILDSIAEYKENKPFKDTKINVHTKNVVNKAIESYEQDPLIMAEHYINIGLNEKLIELMNKNPNSRKNMYLKYQEFFEERLKLCDKYIKDNDKTNNYLNKEILDNLIECYEQITISNQRNKTAIISAYEKIDTLFKERFNIDRNLDILKEHTKQLIEWANIYEMGSEECFSILLKAQTLMVKLLNIKPNDVDTLISLGKLYKDLNVLCILKNDVKGKKNYYKKAQDRFKQAINIDKNNSKLLMNWADMSIRNLNVNDKEFAQKLNKSILKYTQAYELKEDIRIKGACYLQLTELIEEELNEPNAKFVCKNINIIAQELILLKKIKLVLLRIENMCKFKFKNKKMFLETFWNNNKDEIVNSKNDEKFIYFNEMAYYLIGDEDLGNAEEFIKLSSVQENKKYFYLATTGLWYFCNKNISNKECEEKGLYYYNKCIEKYKYSDNDKDKELSRCIEEKKLLEYAKFCYYRLEDKNKTMQIINDNKLGEQCGNYGYKPILSDIIKFKEIVTEEVAVD